MKKLLVILLIIFTLQVAAPAQKAKPKIRTLPANTAQMTGEYPDTLLDNKVIKRRFKTLLGKNYSAFMDSFETTRPFEKKGNYLFSSGCLIHACLHLESAVVVDLINKTIHAAIFRQDEKVKYFNEDNRQTPAAIKDWAKNLTTNH